MPEMQEKELCNCAQLPAFFTRILPIVTLMAKPTRPLWLAPLTYLVLFASLWYSCQRPSGTPQPKQISYSEFLSEERNYSEKTSEAIDEEVRRISDGLYLRAKTILTSRQAELELIARELILKETLDRDQIELLLLAPLIQAPA